MRHDHDEADGGELDLLLSSLRTSVEQEHTRSGAGAPDRSEDQALSDVLSRVMAASARQAMADLPSRRRSWTGLAAAAAAVVVLAVLGLVASSLTSRAALANADETLNRAAAASLGQVDPVLAPGQYRYVRSNRSDLHDLGSPAGEPLSYRASTVTEVWAPQNDADLWLLVRGAPGPAQWVRGSAAEMAAAGLSLADLQVPAGEFRAVCGNFFPSTQLDPVTGQRLPSPACPPGSWQQPTEQFLDALPRVPGALLQRLRQDAPANGGSASARVFALAAETLRTGLVPADLRSAFYSALSELGDLTLTPGAVNLDGRTGTALGIGDDQTRQEIVIDDSTGEFIGERQVLLDGGSADLPDDTLLSWTAVRVVPVSGIGVRA